MIDTVQDLIRILEKYPPQAKIKTYDRLNRAPVSIRDCHQVVKESLVEDGMEIDFLCIY